MAPRDLGGAVQVETSVESVRLQRLKVKHEAGCFRVLSFCFQFQLTPRHIGSFFHHLSFTGGKKEVGLCGMRSKCPSDTFQTLFLELRAHLEMF